MKSKLTSRIIAGKHKNKLLKLPNTDVTRSSKSILKESFFNVVQFDVIDTVFIEAFGGSGSVGLEALSRGAKEAFFCELDKNSYKVLQDNCKTVDVDHTTVLYGNSFDKVPLLLEQLKNRSEPLILFIDPPFDYRDGMENIYEKSFNMVKDIENENLMLVTFEHFTEISMPENLGKFKKFKTKKFGKSSLTYYSQDV